LFTYTSGINYVVVGDAVTSTVPTASACMIPTQQQALLTVAIKDKSLLTTTVDALASNLVVQLAGTLTNYMGAWSFLDGSEVGYACRGQYGPVMLGGRVFLLQKLWLPRVGCSLNKVAAKW